MVEKWWKNGGKNGRKMVEKVKEKIQKKWLKKVRIKIDEDFEIFSRRKNEEKLSRSEFERSAKFLRGLNDGRMWMWMWGGGCSKNNRAAVCVCNRFPSSSVAHLASYYGGEDARPVAVKITVKSVTVGREIAGDWLVPSPSGAGG